MFGNFDFDVPEFMQNMKNKCETEGCDKSIIPGSKLCLDCEFDKDVSKLHEQMDEITSEV